MIVVAELIFNFCSTRLIFLMFPIMPFSYISHGLVFECLRIFHTSCILVNYGFNELVSLDEDFHIGN